MERNSEESHQIPSEAEETTHVSEVDVVIEPPAATMNHVCLSLHYLSGVLNRGVSFLDGAS